MIAVQRWLDEARMRTLLILQVHDELVLEVPEDELEAVRQELPKLMAGVAQLSVPLLAEVGVGANWDEAH
jgi:DNA polymerase-1